MNDAVITLASGKHLRFMRRGTWEYAERPGITGIVGIVAVTDEVKLILVEQWRPPVNNYVIELPAGLVGDEAGQLNESLLDAARRELFEETGYHAEKISILAAGPSSAGMSNEIVTLVRAEQLRKTAAGGGVDHEAIIIHEIPLSVVPLQLSKWISQGKLVDLKVHAAMYFASCQASA